MHTYQVFALLFLPPVKNSSLLTRHFPTLKTPNCLNKSVHQQAEAVALAMFAEVATMGSAKVRP